jgi:predicted nucleotidyltransferase
VKTPGFILKEKITYLKDPTKIFYDSDHWELFHHLRDKAYKIQKRLPFHSYIYGSLARGDIHSKSDIDIILFEVTPSYRIELNLDYISREIVQATPNALIKAHIHVSSEITITFPLINMTKVEIEFYRFSGCLHSYYSNSKKRVPGVSKRLILINPFEKGHVERSLLDDPYECSKILGVSADIIQERIRVLTRRDKVGRTGVFVKEDLVADESFEERLKVLSDTNNYVRRMLKRRGWSG